MLKSTPVVVPSIVHRRALNIHTVHVNTHTHVRRTAVKTIQYKAGLPTETQFTANVYNSTPKTPDRSSHKKTISEADLLSHERAVCPSSRAISGRWRWLHAAQPASDRALATLDERLAAMRTSARQCVVIRNFV